MQRAAIGDTLAADSAIARGVSMMWTPQSTTQLNLRFENPHRVFYKVEELVRRAGGLENDPFPLIMMVRVKENLSWALEAR